ncbi:dolichol kinase [[Candida] anglica]|uniref:dolichol kinase n=1 Tax=[Candida] anglica TaxID=148631 RepID=A0ABP0EG17_9ASCO
MARTRAKKTENTQPTSTSTASVFLKPESNAVDVVDEKITQEDTVPDVVLPDEDDDPSTYGFPLNVIYTVQDFLNDHMTTSKFVQLLVMAYTCQVIYINNEDLFFQNYQIIGFNLLGVSIALILSYHTKNKNHGVNPDKYEKPELPDFNHVSSIFIPLGLSFLLDPQNLLVNLSFNYFVVGNLPIFANILSVVMFNYVYSVEDLEVSFFKTVALYVFIQQFLNYINKSGITGSKSLQKAEIHLLSLLTTKILDAPTFILTTPIEENRTLPIIILQSLIIALSISSVLSYPIFKYYQTLDKTTTFAKTLALIITLFVSIVFVFLTNYRLKPLFNEDPIPWLSKYIMSSEERIQYVEIWATILVASISSVFALSGKMSLNIRRKIWHSVILAILLIKSPLFNQPIFTLISLFGAFFLMLVVELFRYNQFTFIGKFFYQQLRIFQDEKDLNGPLNCSYIFLLLGITIPIVLDYCFSKGDVSIYSFLGLVFLGIGDSSASIIGKKYGTIKWKDSDKTVQGTLAFFASSFVSFYALEYFLPVSVPNWEALFIACILSALLEGASDLNDNFLIPAFSFIALRALDV